MACPNPISRKAASPAKAIRLPRSPAIIACNRVMGIILSHSCWIIGPRFARAGAGSRIRLRAAWASQYPV